MITFDATTIAYIILVVELLDKLLGFALTVYDEKEKVSRLLAQMAHALLDLFQRMQ